MTALGEALAPVLRGFIPSNLLLYGKTGTGKTAVTRRVLTPLGQRTTHTTVPVSVAYSNTRMAGTEYRVLAELATALSLRVPFTGLAVTELFHRILLRIAEVKSHVIVVLDEIDFLVKNYGDETLYDFTRAGEKLSDGHISLIGISNDLKFKELLDPRVLSGLNEEEIMFPPYTADQLKTILTERAQSAFLDGTVTDAAISLCAALAASEHGDARRAVDLLRVCGEVAQREGARHVDESHVRAAMQRIEQDRMVDALKSLPLHQKLVLVAAVFSHSNSSTGELYDDYMALCRRAGSEPLTQRRVSALLTELDLLGLLSVRVVSQGRYGRTKKVNPLVSADFVTEILAPDPSVGGLLVHWPTK